MTRRSKTAVKTTCVTCCQISCRKIFRLFITMPMTSKLSCRAARSSTTDESQMAPCLRNYAICRQYSRFTFCLRHNPRSYCLARPMSVRHCVQARPAPQPPSGAFIVKKTAAASQGRLFYLILLNCTLKIFSRTPQITLF